MMSTSITTIILSAALLATTIFADNFGPGIYGIGGPSYKDGQCSLVKYDAQGMSQTIVPQQTSSLVTASNLACFDSKNNILYFMTEVYNQTTGWPSVVLFPYDVSNPAMTQLKEIFIDQMYTQGYMVGAGEACVGDPGTGDIYIWGEKVSDTNQREGDGQLLLRMSRNSLTDVSFTVVGTYPDIDSSSQLLPGYTNVFDNKRHKWYVPGAGGTHAHPEINYYYIDLQTGNIENTVASNMWPAAVSVYDDALDMILGIDYSKTTPYALNMRYINPVTLANEKTFAADISPFCSHTPLSSIDYQRQIMYVLLHTSTDMCSGEQDIYWNSTLVGISTQTGMPVSEVVIGEFSVSNTAYWTEPWDFLYWSG